MVSYGCTGLTCLCVSATSGCLQEGSCWWQLPEVEGGSAGSFCPCWLPVGCGILVAAKRRQRWICLSLLARAEHAKEWPSCGGAQRQRQILWLSWRLLGVQRKGPSGGGARQEESDN